MFCWHDIAKSAATVRAQKENIVGIKVKNMKMNRVELVNMEFFAHHGCFEEERIIGNKFLVNFWAETDLSVPARTDDIRDTLNYQEVYNIIRREMEQPSRLLENVAARILEGVRKKFPYVKEAQVSIDKLNPPLGGKVGASRVTMSL